MQVLVVGRSGQLARSLAERPEAAGWDFRGRDRLDLADADAVGRAIEVARPELVVNVAAFTAVDLAESEAKIAMQINGHAPGAIALAAKAVGARLIHVSTDYVFDGTAERPYREEDAVAPLGVYGRSKRAGEEAIMASGADAIILRTAWVYSPFGSNFVKTMLRLAREREEIGVVADQIGSPTSALDLAEAIVRIADRWQAAALHAVGGVLHAGGTGEASWADVAEATFHASSARNGPTARVRRITTADYPTPARRPASSRLASDRLQAALGWAMPPWRDSLELCVGRLAAEA